MNAKKVHLRILRDLKKDECVCEKPHNLSGKNLNKFIEYVHKVYYFSHLHTEESLKLRMELYDGNKELKNLALLYFKLNKIKIIFIMNILEPLLVKANGQHTRYPTLWP